MAKNNYLNKIKIEIDRKINKNLGRFAAYLPIFYLIPEGNKIPSQSFTLIWAI